MTEYLVMGGVVLLVVISLQLFMVLKRANSETPQITARLDDFEQAQERMERLVRDEMTRNRDEWNRTGREQRQELAEAFKGLSQSLSGLVDKAAEQQNAHFEGFSGRLDTFSRSSVNQFEAMRSESTNGARLLREEVVKLIGALSDAVTKSVAESAKLQEKQLEVFGGQLNAFIKASTEQQEEQRADQATVAKALREEMVTTLERISNATTDALNTQLKHFAAQIAALSSGMGERSAADSGALRPEGNDAICSSVIEGVAGCGTEWVGDREFWGRRADRGLGEVPKEGGDHQILHLPSD